MVRVKPSAKVVGGSTIQNGVEVSAVEPIATPSPQLRVTVVVAVASISMVGLPP